MDPVFDAQIFERVFDSLAKNLTIKFYKPYESIYRKDSESIHNLVLVAMVTVKGL